MTAATGPASIVLLLWGAAMVVWPGGPVTHRLRPAASRQWWSAGRSRDNPGRGGCGRPAGRDRLLVIGVAATVLLLVAPELWWLLLIAALSVLVRLRRPAGGGRGASRRGAALAVHHELLAACLHAGMPIGAALRAVSDAVPRSARPGDDEADPWAGLDAVAAMLELGAHPESAWAPVEGDPDLRSLAAAARRSALGGAGLSDAVRDQARQLRSQVQAAERRATGRAGVLMVAPLGLCFLPAFLCLGLAPVVLGLLGQLHLF